MNRTALGAACPHFLGAAIPDEWRKPMFHYLKRVSIGQRARRAERALHELPDHILKDIGIRRDAISYAVREHLKEDRI
jgi:hypothetical protein